MTDIAGNRTLNTLLDVQARDRPDADAMIVERADGSVDSRTYAELRSEVITLAQGLARMGVQAGDAVLLHLPNGVEVVTAWFALARLGAVMVPSNPLFTEREVAHLASSARVVAALCREHDAVRVGAATRLTPDRLVLVGTGRRARNSYEWVLTQGELPSELPEVDGDDLVEIIFTSGTTAAPKGVMLTHANCVRAGEQIAKSLALRPDDRLLTSLPVFHVNAQSSTVLAGMSVGAAFVLLETYSASKFLESLVRHQATVTSLVAMQVRTLLRQPASDLDQAHRVRLVFYAINVSDEEFVDFESRFGMRLLNGYGLSEAMMAVTIAPAYGDRRWPSVGLSVVDREVVILDGDGGSVAPGQSGEIGVRGVPGRSLMLGYLDNEEASAAALAGGVLRTGDTGYLDHDGYLYFVDRKKDMIKRSGENVAAREVEAVLQQHPFVVDVAVIGVPDDIRDESIHAYVSVCGEVDGQSLIAWCADRLARFKVPSVVEILEELPKTSIGKIEKRTLVALHARAGSPGAR
ncbi:AMP-binding protein [Nocardioides sp.]|uniref:AMP-binding protein n=1 Tax=Nocardioides sp. TaxID=35761 RepID=UPI003D0BEA96